MTVNKRKPLFHYLRTIKLTLENKSIKSYLEPAKHKLFHSRLIVHYAPAAVYEKKRRKHILGLHSKCCTNISRHQHARSRFQLKSLLSNKRFLSTHFYCFYHHLSYFYFQAGIKSLDRIIPRKTIVKEHSSTWLNIIS